MPESSKNNFKRQAFELYAQLHGHGEVTNDWFDQFWVLIEPYVTDVILSRVYQCAAFELDDQLSEARIRIWNAARRFMIPSTGLSSFLAHIYKTTRNSTIDRFRREECERQSRQMYVGYLPLEPPSPVERVIAQEAIQEYDDYLAREMVRRARFDCVDEPLCRGISKLLSAGAARRDLTKALSDVRFWDKGFLLSYLEVLFRWVHFDMQQEYDIPLAIGE